MNTLLVLDKKHCVRGTWRYEVRYLDEVGRCQFAICNLGWADAIDLLTRV